VHFQIIDRPQELLFMGSDNGGKTAAVLYSVRASAKANQVEPFAYGSR
jgi:hypothetical protein